ncbi:MAG: hypothetical protein LKK08_02825 [Bacteroidales bacterium]|jgi:hypothetical protein|nr:hypothetical protein [Bacteroidales bacterium]MCI2145170.1 hypothetical protein [Bacteroidales bacterium]
MDDKGDIIICRSDEGNVKLDVRIGIPDRFKWRVTSAALFSPMPDNQIYTQDEPAISTPVTSF